MMDKSMDRWVNKGRNGKIHDLVSGKIDEQMGDWCIAVAEQTIFSARPKSAVIEIGPDHARGWRRDTLAHTWRNITDPQKDSF